MSLPTPYYDCDGITIYHADCRDILPHLPKVDLVLTDPPYGTGEHLRIGGELIKTRQWWDCWDTAWMGLAAFRAAIAFIPPQRIKQCLNLEFPFIRLLSWVSENPVCMNGVSPRYGMQFAVAFGDSFDVTYELDWFKYKTNEQTEHPHEKPLPVIQWAARAIISSGTILDPFMGSGTMLRAAKDLGRKAIGIEIEEKYCEIAVRRLAQEVLPL